MPLNIISDLVTPSVIAHVAIDVSMSPEEKAAEMRKKRLARFQGGSPLSAEKTNNKLVPTKVVVLDSLLAKSESLRNTSLSVTATKEDALIDDTPMPVTTVAERIKVFFF